MAESVQSESEEKPRIFVIAMDGSEHSKFAFHWYMEHIYKENDKVYLVNSVEFHENIPSKWLHEHDVDADSIEPVLKEERSKCREKLNVLEELLKNFKVDGEVHAVHSKKPGEGIIQKAKELGASCIVTGTRGQNALKRTLMGSVSDYILHHTKIPVIVCRQKHVHA